MAGYNTTVEALAAGVRPLLVPRRSPRREQAIRATRLASLGLADIVDEDATVDEVSWLLRRPRRLDPHVAGRGRHRPRRRRAHRPRRSTTLAGVRHRSFAAVGAGR